MIEYKLIIPTHDNDGNSIGHIHDKLQRELCEVFGGFTQTEAFGGWRGDKGPVIMETVKVYSVAAVVEADGDFSPIDWFRQRAKYICKAANQEAVYIQKGIVPEIIAAD